MQTLVSRESYAEIERRFWKRARVVIGIIFGVVMCLASVIQQTAILGFGLALSVGIVTGVVTGVAFGFLWAWAMHRSARKYRERVYEGDSTVIGEVPRKRKYSYRVPCNHFVTNNVTVGGILYIGRAGILFMPNRRYKGEKPIDLDPEGLAVWPVDWTPNWWGRTFVVSGLRVLEVVAGDERHRFAFPDVDVVVPKIREALGQA